MKIAVIGYSGAGKSTLAKILADRLCLPLLYLDKIQFTANWSERNRPEALAMVEHFLEQEHWVIDGTYPEFLLQRRLEEADQILFLDFNRFICLRQAFCRYLSCRGTVRESVSEGCIERFDREFFRWLIWDGRSRKRVLAFRSIIRNWPEKTVVLKNRKQVTDYLMKQV